MVGVGFTEMIIIAGIALVVLGPEKFPEFAKIAIRAIRDIRGYFDEVKTEIAKEVKPLEKELNELTKKSNELYREILTETDPSYTSKGYTPSTNYVEHSYQTDTDIAKKEEKQDSITSEGISGDTDASNMEITSNDNQEIAEPYDPDIPQADLQKMTQATPHNDEEAREAKEETDIDNQNNIQFPERLDG
ncbi:MAG TPA: Sec-independent protein translocase protein TatB [Candidatus Hydrogenedens sp.]|nr:Sec-independent protein translocase protein TatB [Candidatus Hydrogenedens sp.]